MADGPTSTHSLGLEQEGPHVRGVELVYSRQKTVCKQIFLLDGQVGEEDVKPLYMSEHGKQLEKSARSSVVVTGMDASSTIIRQIDVKLKKEKDIDAVLSFQAEPILPFPIDEAYLDKSILEVFDDGSLITVFGVRKDHLQSHIDDWIKLGIEPEVVGSDSHALAIFSDFCSKSDDHIILINVGFETTTVALAHKGKLLGSQSFKGGVNDLIAALLRDEKRDASEASTVTLKEMDPAKLDSASHPEFNKIFQQIERDSLRISYGLVKFAHIGDIASVLVTGEGVHLKNLSQQIAENLGKPLQTVQLPEGFGLNELEACFYAIPIGLALTGLPQNIGQINFRQRDMAYPHPWKRLRIPIATFVALCLGLAFAVYLLGQVNLGIHEDKVRQEYVGLVAYLKKDYAHVEKQMGKKNGDEASDASIAAPKNLTPYDITNRLDVFEKEIDAAPNTIALFPNTPRVSDVLAWLSNHPQVAMPGKVPGTKEAQIHIDSFNYKMVKRPDITKPREKYQVQVDIDFTSDTPRAARMFYDSLIAPNDVIDPKGEVKWTAASGKYRVSFYLKDKTIYPNP